MKKTLLFIAILWIIGSDSNPLILAKEHFAEGKYIESIQYYKEAIYKYPKMSQSIHYNIGQCYEALDSIEQAFSFYRQGLSSSEPKVSSLSYNPIGVLHVREGRYEEALRDFRKSLQYNPDNEEARFNYELLRKRLKPEEPEEEPENQESSINHSDTLHINPPPQNEEEENNEDSNNEEQNEEEDSEEESNDPDQEESEDPDPSDQNNPNIEGVPIITLTIDNDPTEESSDQSPTDTLSLDQARRLLEGMRENEIQFLQQLPKKAKGQASNGDQPDW